MRIVDYGYTFSPFNRWLKWKLLFNYINCCFNKVTPQSFLASFQRTKVNISEGTTIMFCFMCIVNYYPYKKSIPKDLDYAFPLYNTSAHL